MSDHSKLPPHIGRIVRQTLKSQGRTVTWLAQQLPCDRSNVYKIFAKRTLDTELLLTLSKVLGVDFFQIYSSFLKKWCQLGNTFMADEAAQKIICCQWKSVFLCLQFTLQKKLQNPGYFLPPNDISIIENTINVCFKKLIFLIILISLLWNI